jgi:hypothetical protein
VNPVALNALICREVAELILVKDKRREAQFFLDKASEHTKGGREFRFYLSAFLSAARSVTFVMQAELRPKFRASFDRWYAPRREALGLDPVARIVKDARNAFIKQGSRQPRYAVSFRSPAGKESVTVSYTIEELGNDGVNEMRVSIDPELGHIPFEIDDGRPIEDQLDEIDAKVEEKMMAIFDQTLERLQKRVQISSLPRWSSRSSMARPHPFRACWPICGAMLNVCKSSSPMPRGISIWETSPCPRSDSRLLEIAIRFVYGMGERMVVRWWRNAGKANRTRVPRPFYENLRISGD